MATAGSGDVLTGLIAGLIAQGMSVEEATCCGAFLHGRAGDIARDRIGEWGLLAGDIQDAVPEAILGIFRKNRGFPSGLTRVDLPKSIEYPIARPAMVLPLSVPSRGASCVAKTPRNSFPDPWWPCPVGVFGKPVPELKMTKVREAIEEIIEESYLLGRSEREIRQDFKRFMDTCFAVIHDNIKDREAVSSLLENLEREQAVILIADRGDGSGEAEADEETVGSGTLSADDLCEKVARHKRQILRAIAKYDPELVRLIDEHRFQGEMDEPLRPRFSRKPPGGRQIDWAELKLQLLKIGYALTICLIILATWLSFIQ